MTTLIEAKLKVKNNSCYKWANGQVFPVSNFGNRFIDIVFNDGKIVQFRLSEVELRIYNKYNLDYIVKIAKN